MGMMGIRVGMQGIRVGMIWIGGIREGMRVIGVGIWGIRMEIRGIWAGNEGDEGENLLIRVEIIIKKKCGEIKIKINVHIYEVIVLTLWYGDN